MISATGVGVHTVIQYLVCREAKIAVDRSYRSTRSHPWVIMFIPRLRTFSNKATNRLLLLDLCNYTSFLHIIIFVFKYPKCNSNSNVNTPTIRGQSRLFPPHLHGLI